MNGIGDMTESTRNFNAALEWHDRGYNVVPRKSLDAKHPGVKWRALQGRRVRKTELLCWTPRFQNGVGFITGQVSNVIVIETDGPEGELVISEFEERYGPLPRTRTIRSGSGRGLHRHFRHPGHMVKTASNTSIKVDVRGDGGFCVLPPSKHKSGGVYEIVDDVDPVELPKHLLSFISARSKEAGRAGGTPHRSRLGKADDVGDCKLFGDVPDYILRSSPKGNIPITRAPPPVEVMRDTLEDLADRGYFQQRSGVLRSEDGKITSVGWIEAGMALKAAYGDSIGYDLWSVTHIDDRARRDAREQWESFASSIEAGHISVATLIKAARDAGNHSEPDRRLGRLSPSSPTGEPLTSRDGDIFNGRLFAEMYRNRLLHIFETGDWLLFDSQRGWTSAPPFEQDRAAKNVLARVREHVAKGYKLKGSDDPRVKSMMKHVSRSSDLPRLRAMIEVAKSEPGMTAELANFDSDPMLLGLANGVLDLRTGNLLDISPELLVSKRCSVAYDPTATCQRFKQFLKEIHPEIEVRRFLRRLMGYCLTGLVDEQLILFFHGSGSNGKSVFVELFAWLLGDYARKIATEMLMHHQRNPQGPSPDIVSLKGARFVYANETEEGRRLAESRVKDLTGGDTLSARVPYGKADITFRPTHKLFIVGNHKPEIMDTSHGMWRRVGLVGFEQTIAEAQQDHGLLEKLQAEGPGILNWMLAGLRDWLDSGLGVPDRIKAATSAYREEQDVIGDWINEDCKIGVGYSVKKSDLYSDYKYWAELNGHHPLAQGRLTRRLNERGYKLAADKRTVRGLTLSKTDIFARGS